MAPGPRCGTAATPADRRRGTRRPGGREGGAKGGSDARDRDPGTRRAGRADGGQPARGRVLRRRPPCPELRDLRRRAARHAGVVVHPRRRPAGARALRHRACRRDPVFRRDAARRPAAGDRARAHDDRRELGAFDRRFCARAARLPRDPGRRTRDLAPRGPGPHRQLGAARRLRAGGRRAVARDAPPRGGRAFAQARRREPRRLRGRISRGRRARWPRSRT